MICYPHSGDFVRNCAGRSRGNALDRKLVKLAGVKRLRSWSVAANGFAGERLLSVVAIRASHVCPVVTTAHSQRSTAAHAVRACPSASRLCPGRPGARASQRARGCRAACGRRVLGGVQADELDHRAAGELVGRHQPGCRAGRDRNLQLLQQHRGQLRVTAKQGASCAVPDSGITCYLGSTPGLRSAPSGTTCRPRTVGDLEHDHGSYAGSGGVSVVCVRPTGVGRLPACPR